MTLQEETAFYPSGLKLFLERSEVPEKPSCPAPSSQGDNNIMAEPWEHTQVPGEEAAPDNSCFPLQELIFHS